MGLRLTDALPSAVIVGGRAFPINTDFRAGIKFETLLSESRNRNDKEFLLNILNLYYGDNIPQDVETAVREMLTFYALGNPTEESNVQTNKKTANERIYDFNHDAPYIYAAFQQVYGIDLIDVPHLHWWKFNALFSSLPDDCLISQIMKLRSTNLSEIKDTKERSRIAAAKAKWALPSLLTPEEKVSLAGSIFAGGLKK